MKISKKENAALIKIKKQKIKIILNVPKNNECFECANLNPEFISLNNGIFICKKCIKNHINLPKSISNILKNDLNNLTLKNIQYLCFGGNEKLKQFVQNEFPKLKKFEFHNVYKTYAMDYYRKYLEYLIEGGIKPNKPNKNKAYDLIKINNINNKNKNTHIKINIDNKISNLDEANTNTKKNTHIDNNKEKNLKLTKSSGRLRPNLNLILSNFNNSLNNFNTINIYNYNNKIFTETNYKKRFFPKIFKHIHMDDISETNNLTDLNNITFNKEENNKKINEEIKYIQNKKMDTNIKIIKRKVFLDDKYFNLQNHEIYEKPIFQNYLNTFNKGNKNHKDQKHSNLSSSDFNFFSNDVNEIKTNKKNNIFVNKSIRNSQKIFKKKTVGNSFSIHDKRHQTNSSNNSIERITYVKKEIFNIRNSNKAKLKNKLMEEFVEMNKSKEEKGLIKVNRQININKKRKRYSLNNIIVESKYDYDDDFDENEKDRKHRIKLNNVQKSKIIERIHRVTTHKKEKSFNSLNKDNKTGLEKDLYNEEINENNFNKKDKKSSIVKNNNFSDIIMSPNSKKTNKVFTEPKPLTKNDFLSKIAVKELYKRKKDNI